MRITCEHCGKNLNLPDDRLPSGGRISIKCPCERKEVITLDLDALKQQNAAPTAVVEPEIFPPGAKVAFVYVGHQGWKDAIKRALQAQGFHLSSATGTTEAVQKTALNSYDLILIQDDADSESLLAEVNSWNGIKRREINVVLIGSRGQSMHPQESFVRGVNFYLNIDDENRAEELLDETIKGYVLHYEPWVTGRNELAAEGGVKT